MKKNLRKPNKISVSLTLVHIILDYWTASLLIDIQSVSVYNSYQRQVGLSVTSCLQQHLKSENR